MEKKIGKNYNRKGRFFLCHLKLSIELHCGVLHNQILSFLFLFSALLSNLISLSCYYIHKLDPKLIPAIYQLGCFSFKMI